jgi:SPW repeat
MRPWTRLQDWGTLIAGLYAALSPIWVSTSGERDAFWALIVLGALLAVTALFSLGLPGVVIAGVLGSFTLPISMRTHRQAIQP